jgi:hypothetical protein
MYECASGMNVYVKEINTTRVAFRHQKNQNQKMFFLALETVLGIRDILVRIRIPGSVPLTNEASSGI